MKKSIISFLLIFFGFGASSFAKINNYHLDDVLKFTASYQQAGSIIHNSKKFNIWTKTDNKALDESERKVVAISEMDNKGSKRNIVQQYYIIYYKDGSVEYSKLLDHNNSEDDLWYIQINPKGVAWYKERFIYHEKKENGEQNMIGKWKYHENDAHNPNEMIWGVFNISKDKKEIWPVWGFSDDYPNNLQSKTGLSNKEKKRQFDSAKKYASEAEKVFNFLLELEKKYYAKVIKEDKTKIVKKEINEEIPIELERENISKQKLEIAKIREELKKEKEELEKLKKKLIVEKELSNTTNVKTDEKYYALLIGNNNYKYLEKLDAAENDAKVLANILKNDYGFEVNLLLNADYETTVNSLYKLSRKLKKEDNLLIFYAGHGFLDKKQNRGYWQPIDAKPDLPAKWISNSLIADEVKATEAKHVLLIVDSCFSGSLMRSGSNIKSNKKLNEKYIKLLQTKKARLVITSGGNEPVMDSDGGNHSVFAQKLIDTLKDNHNVISTQKIFENIRKYVVVNAEQTPERAAIYKAGHDGGDFLFFAKN